MMKRKLGPVENSIINPFQGMALTMKDKVFSLGSPLHGAGLRSPTSVASTAPTTPSSLLSTINASYEQKQDSAIPMVVVQSSARGGAEVLLSRSPFLKGSSRKSVSTRQTGSSSALISSVGHQNDVMFKLLRGRDLSVEKSIVKIHLERRLSTDLNTDNNFGDDDDDDEDDTLLASMQVGSTIANSPDPIWGGESNTWSIDTNKILREDEHATLVVQIFPCDRNSLKCVAHARIPVIDILYRPYQRNLHPNVWIDLKYRKEGAAKTSQQQQADGEKKQPKIQIRLSLPRQSSLHSQIIKDCPVLSPGPALSSNLTSYRLRKMALWSCGPVLLNIYDVSNNSKIAKINRYTKALHVGGIFHAAIEIYGKEYSFGGTRNRASIQSGIFACPPKACPMHHYRESIYLGDCELSPSQVEAILVQLRPNWLAKSYNLFRKNCCFFSQEFATELGVGDIPAWVYSLATSTEFIEPIAVKLNQYVTNRNATRVAATSNTTNRPAAPIRPATPATPTPPKKKGSPANSKKKSHSVKTVSNSKQPAVRKQQVSTENPTLSDLADADADDNLLDHAMASRIQRSYRCHGHKLSERRKQEEKARPGRVRRVSITGHC